MFYIAASIDIFYRWSNFQADVAPFLLTNLLTAGEEVHDLWKTTMAAATTHCLRTPQSEMCTSSFFQSISRAFLSIFPFK